jgi:hypothetical protein
MTIVIDGTTGISGVDGTASNPSYEGTDSNTGIFYPAADTVAIGTGGTEALRVNSAQNVGVGTTSPTAASSRRGLVLRGNANGAELIVQSTSATDGTSDGFSLTTVGTDAYLFNRLNGFTAFATNNTERARITSGGDLLVGTTNTDPTFNRVNGTNIKNAGGILTRSAGGASDFGISVTSGIHITFYTDNGSARVTAGNIASNGATTSYNGTSDYRLKDNVQPLNNALNRVSKLRPVTWTWKEGYGGTQPECEGFVAHELQAILPIAVTGEKDAIDENGNPVYQGVDTSFLVATLTAAIQELNAKVDAQAAEIAALKGNA